MTDPAKPPVVREWIWGHSETPEWHEALDEHNAAISHLQAELRSRPTREEFEGVEADAVRRHHDACDLQEKVWALEAKLAASEAALERLRAVAQMVDAWGNGLRHHTAHESKMVKAARAALAPVAAPPIDKDKPKIFKTTVLGMGPWCVEFPDGEIITTRSEERARQIAALVGPTE